MAIPFSFLVSWANDHVSEDSSLKYVRTLKKKQFFKTVEEILSSTDSGKKISDLRACLSSRIDEIRDAFQNGSVAPVITPSAVTVLGDTPDSDAFADRLMAFIKDYLLVKLKSFSPMIQTVFRESFVPQPFHTSVPNDDNLSSQFGVSSQTIRNTRNNCIKECQCLLLDGIVLGSYSTDPSLVSDVNAIKDSFGGGISYETACRITGINDDRTFYFLLRLFNLDLAAREGVRIPAVLQNNLVSPYSKLIGRVIGFFREETICIRFEEDVIPALKKITKDANLLESFKSIILHSDEFVHYQVNGQDYIALRWDLLQFLPQRVCWIVFQEKAFDLKTAVSSDRIVTLYNSGDYRGKFKESRIERDQIRASQLSTCWRLMNIGKQEYWMIRNSKDDEFDIESFVKKLQTPGMTYAQYIQAAKDSGLMPIYPETTVANFYIGGSNIRCMYDWPTMLTEAEAMIKAQNAPLKSASIIVELYHKHQLFSSFKSVSASFLRMIRSDSGRFVTQSCDSARDGVWIALPGMTFPKSYRDQIREKAIDYLLKAPNYTMLRSDLYARVESLVPPDRVKTSSLQSIFDDIDTFTKNGSGRDTTITLNPLLVP